MSRAKAAEAVGGDRELRLPFNWVHHPAKILQAGEGFDLAIGEAQALQLENFRSLMRRARWLVVMNLLEP
jgi:hypothetical protein